MPYKLSKSGKAVLVKRGNRWVVLKRHPTREKARKHVAALNINVHHPEKARKKRKKR